jgi:hypothetical protein
LRREGRNAPAALYARVHFCLRKSHARPRVQQAPGLPCALYFDEGQTKMQASGAMRCEKAKLYPRHCERSEAIHLSPCRGMDCFAALAMTGLASIPRYDLALVPMNGLGIGQVAGAAAHQKFRAASADRVVAATAGGRFAVVIFRQ